MKCALCKQEIATGTPAASIVGGLFPAGDEDLFVVDEDVMAEAYTHLTCLVRSVEDAMRARIEET